MASSEKPKKVSNERRRILLLTNVEAGQSNVILAVGHELDRMGHEVHFAALEPFRKTLEKAIPHAAFHPLKGPDMKEIWESEPDLNTDTGRGTPANVFKMAKDLRAAFTSVFPWSGPQYVEVFNSVVDVVDELKPDLCVTDPALNPALTALRAMRQPFLMLAPNTIKDFALGAQPIWHQFAKFPCLASGFPYPIPWYLVPRNIIYVFLAFCLAIFDSRRLNIMKYVKEHTGADVFDLGDFNMKPEKVAGIKVLVANREEIEFPLEVMPDYIIPCGPIIRPSAPLAEADPELDAWLDRAPTIYINLGTHVQLDREAAIDMANALSQTIDKADIGDYKGMRGLQVLWKLKKVGVTDDDIHRILGRHIESGRVRMTEWLNPEPAALVMHRNIAIVVNHGGANSFLEAASAGKPQMILPPWMDCFDFACRVEVLGIGVWGNKRTTGRWETNDLCAAFKEVLAGPRAADIAEEARAIGELCNEEGPGREKAAKYILEEIDALKSRR